MYLASYKNRVAVFKKKDALRSALWEPATSQNLAAQRIPPTANARSPFHRTGRPVLGGGDQECPLDTSGSAEQFAPLTAEGGPPPCRRLVLVGFQEGVAMDTETLVSHEPEADLNRKLVTSSILQQIDSSEGEVEVPVVRRSRAISRAFAALG